jgi:hypothetical protein
MCPGIVIAVYAVGHNWLDPVLPTATPLEDR